MESTFASRIRQYRQERGLSQQALAELCGLTQGNIAHMENGTEPKQSNVSKLVSGLPDLNPDWLLTGTGPMLRDGRALSPAPVAAAVAPVAPAPYLSHTNLSPEEIGKLLMKVAALEARAEAAEREAAKYWTVVERYAGKKTEGNRLPAAAEPEAVYTTPERTPVGYKVGKSTDATECKVIRLVPVEESVSVTPSYAVNQ